jgi:hypothetical protein
MAENRARSLFKTRHIMLQLCTKCQTSPATHDVYEMGNRHSFCCTCYVSEGNPPSNWHVECMKAWGKKQLTQWRPTRIRSNRL